MKTLNLCMSGQGRAVLISGDEGFGKTALVEAFTNLAEKSYRCPVLAITITPQFTASRLFVALVQSLLSVASKTVKEALVDINDQLKPLGLTWTQGDLLQVVTLSALQNAVSGHQGLSREVVTDTLRRSLPFFKRMKPELRARIDEVAEILTHPWLTIAVSLMNPVNPHVQLALDWVSHITGTPRNLPPLLSTQKNASEDQLTEEVLEEPPQQLHDVFINLLSFVNNGLAPSSSALLIAFDQWELLAKTDKESREEIKSFLNEVLLQTVEQRNNHLMVIVSGRTVNESYTLGGSLYSSLRAKQLLAPLSGGSQKQMISSYFQEHEFKADEKVVEDLIKVADGNPAWLTLMLHRIGLERNAFESRPLSWDVYQERFAVEHSEDIIELLMTRLQLAFVGSENAFAIAFETLIQRYPYSLFTQDEAIKTLTANGTNRMFAESFIKAIEAHHILITQYNAEGVLQYKFFTPFLQSMLLEKYKTKSQTLSPEDKSASLKTILPLALEAGELTPEKAGEIIAMATGLEDDDLLAFVEKTFISALTDSAVSKTQKLMLMDVLPLLSNNSGYQILFNLLNDKDSDIVVRSLTSLTGQIGQSRGASLEAIQEAFLPLLAHEDPIIKAHVMNCLAKLPIQSTEIIDNMMLCLDDTEPAINRGALLYLIQKQVRNERVFEGILDLLEAEPDPALSQWLFRGLEGFDSAQVVPILTRFLDNQPSSELWINALFLLMARDLEKALPLIKRGLFESTDPDQTLAIIKRLGTRAHALYEALLAEFLTHEHSTPLPAEARWMAIRSLGWIGQTRDSYVALEKQQPYADKDDILKATLNTALRQVGSRLLPDSVPVSQPPALSLSREDRPQQQQQLEAAAPVPQKQTEPDPSDLVAAYLAD